MHARNRLWNLQAWPVWGRIAQHRKLIAVLIGVVLAGTPLIAFDAWFSRIVEIQSQDEAAVWARRMIKLAEARVSRVIETLDSLSARGTERCSPDDVQAMRDANFAVSPIKEITVIAPNGSVLCSDLSPKLEQLRVLSFEDLPGSKGYRLEVVSLDGQAATGVRLRKTGGTDNRSLTALVPGDLFVPQVGTQGGTVNAYARMDTQSGRFVSEAGPIVAASERDLYATGVATSDRYGFVVTTMMPRGRLPTAFGELSKLSLFIPAVIAVLLMAFAALLPKRRPPNPVSELEGAIKRGELVPYYQPIVDIRSGRLIGAEVLARWKRADGTLGSPATFIPLAESCGLIIDLTYSLMQQVCRDVGAQIGARPGFKIGFNFTARLFNHPSIVRDVRRIFTASPIPLSQVVIEVTEREPIEDLTETRQVIAALQGLGARVAIDDVGTGHSGLSYMLKLGVDIIKIDKMFVDALGSDRKSTTIVETLVDLAHNMRMDIIAEGVENFEQVEHLRDLGIRSAQGFVFAPPLPGSAFLQLVEAIDPLPAADAVTPGEGRRYTSARLTQSF